MSMYPFEKLRITQFSADIPAHLIPGLRGLFGGGTGPQPIPAGRLPQIFRTGPDTEGCGIPVQTFSVPTSVH